MTLVLDAGALLAVERGDRELMALLKGELRRRRAPVTHGGVVRQIWRGGKRHERLAAFLRGVAVAPLDEDLGRRSGALLGRARRSDVIDAAVVLLACTRSMSSHARSAPDWPPRVAARTSTVLAPPAVPARCSRAAARAPYGA
jgi:hypothetical protein